MSDIKNRVWVIVVFNQHLTKLTDGCELFGVEPSAHQTLDDARFAYARFANEHHFVDDVIIASSRHYARAVSRDNLVCSL